MELTLDMVLNLPDDMLEKSKQNSNYIELLSKKATNEYDIAQIKKEVDQLFQRFEKVRYLYKFPTEHDSIVISSSNSTRKSHISDPTFKVASKLVDDQIWATNIYYRLLMVATKLNYEEIIFLVNTYFGNKSEEFIAQKLDISRNALQIIKKSCLIKVWSEVC